MNLDKSYDQLFRNYKKGRRSDIKSAKKRGIQIKETKNTSQLINLFRQEKHTEVKNKAIDYNKLDQLSEGLYELEKMKILELYNKQDVLLGGAIFFNRFKEDYLLVFG